MRIHLDPFSRAGDLISQIAVISDGMNLTGVDPYNQKIVLGAVILAAVLLDMLRKKGWGRLSLWRIRSTKAQAQAQAPPVAPRDPRHDAHLRAGAGRVS